MARFIGRIGSESGNLKFVLGIVSRPMLFFPAPSNDESSPLLKRSNASTRQVNETLGRDSVALVNVLVLV